MAEPAAPGARPSPRSKARAAGFFWLMTILGGVFALLGDRLVLSRGGTTALVNVLAHETLFRWTSVANLFAAACYVVATVLVYTLLKAVDRDVSLLAATFSVIGCAVSGVGFVLRFGPLVILGGSQYPGAFTVEQL